MNLTMTTNAPEMVAAFDSLFAQHRARPGSALRTPRVQWRLSLHNDAVATNAEGKEFEYYRAVDTGRVASRSQPGKFLVFGNKRAPHFLKSVRSFGGLHITDNSLAVILAQFSGELDSALAQRSFQRLGVGDFKPAEFIREANKAARAARTSGRNRSRIFRISANDSINKLVRLPNWLPIASVFNRVVLKQVDVFKSKTPLRRGGTLHYIGGGATEVLTHDMQHLRSGYKLSPNAELAALLPSTATAPKFKLTKTPEL